MQTHGQGLRRLALVNRGFRKLSDLHAMHYCMATDSACAFDNLVDRRADITAQELVSASPPGTILISFQIAAISALLILSGQVFPTTTSKLSVSTA